VAIIAIVTLPVFLVINSPLGEQTMAKAFSSAPGTSMSFGNWGIFSSLVLPLGLLLFSMFIFRADLYEMFYQYTPVLIVMLIDLALGIANLLLAGSASMDLHYLRISSLFYRFFFFIPFLYFSSMPIRRRRLGRQSRFTELESWLQVFLQKSIHGFRVQIGVALIVLISAILMLAHMKVYENHNSNVAPAMRKVESQLKISKELPGEKGSIVAYESIAANLLVPSVGASPSLLSSAFGNYVDEQGILERIVLYAKIFNWTEMRFMDFMMPSGDFSSMGSLTPSTLIDDNTMNSGLGYWLMNHEKYMEGKSLEQYRAMLEDAYSTMEIEGLLIKHNVRSIVATNQLESVPASFRLNRSIDGLSLFARLD
jgi:hypothetical protein